MRPTVEELEPRTLCSAAPTVIVAPLRHPRAPLFRPPAPAFGAETGTFVRQWYGFNRVPENGAGQTIAIVDAFADPTLRHDLAVYDRALRLPGCDLAVAQPEGAPGPDPTGGSWGFEIALDVEVAHAIAPGAKILLVEANDASDGSLLPAVQWAAAQPGVTSVNMSWGRGEQPGDPSLLGAFAQPAGHPGVTFVASAGDAPGTEWPSVAPPVLAVGGTFVLGGGEGNPWREINDNFDGGGRSLEFPGRVTPDVSASQGAIIYTSAFGKGRNGWGYVFGTSCSAPLWSALVAVAAQRHGPGDYAAAIRALPQADFRLVPNPDGSVPTNEGRGVPVADAIIRDL